MTMIDSTGDVYSGATDCSSWVKNVNRERGQSISLFVLLSQLDYIIIPVSQKGFRFMHLIPC